MSGGRFLSSSFIFFELTKVAVIILVLLATLALVVGLPLLVRGESMEPNFESGEIVIVERVSYFNDQPIKRGDVVAAKFPADAKKTRLIKRVIGLPGESVQVKEGRISINGYALTESYAPKLGAPPYEEMGETSLREDEYFLVGDNRPGSSDSRLWGPVVKQDILGKVSFVIYPFDSMRFIDRPSY